MMPPSEGSNVGKSHDAVPNNTTYVFKGSTDVAIAISLDEVQTKTNEYPNFGSLDKQYTHELLITETHERVTMQHQSSKTVLVS